MFLTLFREQIKIRSNMFYAYAYVLQQQNTVKKQAKQTNYLKRKSVHVAEK